MTNKSVPRKGLLGVVLVLIGTSLACNLPKFGNQDQINLFIDNFIGWDYEDFTREDVLAYFDSIEGEQTYDVTRDPGEYKADCDHSLPMGEDVPVEVNHIHGNTPKKDKVTITDANGTREYQYSSIRGSEPFMYCRNSLEFAGTECVRFTTSWRFELIVYDSANWPANECYRATYQTTASAAEDEGDEVIGSDVGGLIIARGKFEIPCGEEWTNTDNFLELQLDPVSNTVHGTGTSRCFRIEHMHSDRETRTDTLTTFVFLGDVDSPGKASGKVTITEGGQIGDYTWEEEVEVPFDWRAEYTEGIIQGMITSPGSPKDHFAYGRFLLNY